MGFDISQLGPLAAAVEKAGAPILAGGLRALGASGVASAIPIPFAGPLVGVLLNSIADAIGGPASDLGALAEKISNDPNAGAKIQAVENTHLDDLNNAIDFAKLQTDQNAAELGLNVPLWAKVLFAGWRPAMGWIGGPLLVAYQLAAVTFGFKPVPSDMFNWTVGAWGALAGLRTVDKWQGVASPVPVIPAPVKRILKRAAK